MPYSISDAVMGVGEGLSKITVKGYYERWGGFVDDPLQSINWAASGAGAMKLNLIRCWIMQKY